MIFCPDWDFQKENCVTIIVFMLFTMVFHHDVKYKRIRKMFMHKTNRIRYRLWFVLKPTKDSAKRQTHPEFQPSLEVVKP